MKRLLLSSAACIALVLGLASPARADMTLDFPDGVIYPNCTYHQASYDAGDDDWEITADVLDPTGGEHSFVWIHGDDATAGTTSGSDGVQFCGGMDRPGTYTVEGEYCWYDADYNEYCKDVSDTFTMRKAYSRTSLTSSDYSASYGQRLTFKATSKAEYRMGYFANTYERVRFQVKVDGVWRTFASTTTDDTGVARVTGSWKFRSTKAVRAQTVGTSEFRSSYSAVVWIS